MNTKRERKSFAESGKYRSWHPPEIKNPTIVVRQNRLFPIGKPIILVSAINPGLRQHRVQALRCARLERLIIGGSFLFLIYRIISQLYFFLISKT